MMRPEPQTGRLSLALVVALGLLAACENKDAPDDQTNPARAPAISRVLPANEAIAGAHIPSLDPMTMVDAEIRKVLGPAPRCEFRYTSEGNPVLAATAASTSDMPDGVVKVNGHLVELTRASAEAGVLALAAGSIRVTVTPEGGEPTGRAHRREVDVVFEIRDRLRAGYRGYYRCVE